ncbi:GPI ethanolamine phosphate transferase 2 [Frankliniella fusca]|uniref:GPI ethanolamine phosphate transferase 2 n=1 Tax=Frankliniella fusca TaxID=407009 RepID=A0AAE1HTV6_9NEOP|nr:GPI ethanolamine phosphate transferase 2 [Frankliniella fusca]
MMKECNDVFRRDSRSLIQTIFTLFWICSALFSLSIFLYGFFPLKSLAADFATENDIPSTILNSSVENEVLYKRRSGRFVFVLIDAFRWDFLENQKSMPYIFELKKSRKAIFLTARCHPPTATMPRIKALMTGTIPNYIDVILNLGSDRVMEDNLIHQAVENGLKVVFYGDETWLHLFPDKFLRKEGTTSFFVSDYSEVDSNVTRHIDPEMKANDWDILILHYLGLDHIGHLAGPSSPLVPPKLREMDEAIEKIHRSLQQWDNEHPGKPSYLIVVGDHGMHDLGSHGGATTGEVLVSLIMIENLEKNFPISGRPEVSQIDITATIAVLLGLPIPKLSLGVLIPPALKRLTDEQYLFAVLYNAEQVASQFLLADPEGISKECFKMFVEAKSTHMSWMKNKSSALRDAAETLYINATQQMSSYVVKTLVTFDLLALSLGCFTFIQILLLLFYSEIAKRGDIFMKAKWKKSAVFTTGLALFFLNLVFSSVCSQILSVSAAYLFSVTSCLLLIGFHSWILCVRFSTIQIKKFSHTSVTTIFLIVGSILHTISFSASSFIEEEHQTWYFLWITLILLLFFSFCFSDNQSYFTQFQLFCIMVGHRILRKLNQTGDKWASLPDIAGWLEMAEHKVILSFVFVFGLITLWYGLIWLKCLTNTFDKALTFLAMACIFIYQSLVGDLLFSFHLEDSRGVKIVQLFWLISGLLLIRTFRMCSSPKQVIKGLIHVWTLTSALLLGPYNVILLPYLILTSLFIQSALKNTVDCNLMLLWLGNGNSNSLSSINVATGYIGADHQTVAGAGLMILVHTYCFPVLSALLALLRAARQKDSTQRNQEMISTLHLCFIHRLLPLTVYCIIVTLQRHHLFIWSVFAPKLLYEAVHSVIFFAFVASGCVLLLFCDKEK